MKIAVASGKGGTGKTTVATSPALSLAADRGHSPIAVTLASMIRQAVSRVEGVTEQELEIVGFINAEELNALLKQALKM
ncbi:MAG TPA: hypothetical protein VFZ76_03995 [Anaerolineales bacterium]